jgi:hypothetical protein
LITIDILDVDYHCCPPVRVKKPFNSGRVLKKFKVMDSNKNNPNVRIL